MVGSQDIDFVVGVVVICIGQVYFQFFYIFLFGEIEILVFFDCYFGGVRQNECCLCVGNLYLVYFVEFNFQCRQVDGVEIFYGMVFFGLFFVFFCYVLEVWIVFYLFICVVFEFFWMEIRNKNQVVVIFFI